MDTFESFEWIRLGFRMGDNGRSLAGELLRSMIVAVKDFMTMRSDDEISSLDIDKNSG